MSKRDPELEKFKEEQKEYFDNKINELNRRLYDIERKVYNIEFSVRRHERYHRIRREIEDWSEDPVERICWKQTPGPCSSQPSPTGRYLRCVSPP